MRALLRDGVQTGDYSAGPSEDQILAAMTVLSKPAEASGRRGVTGRDGVAKLLHLKPGKWYVEVSAKGFAAKGVKSVRISSGHTNRVTVRLSPGATVSGRVVTAGGKPASGARVLAVPFDDAMSFPLAAEESTTAGADGVFTLDGLERGKTYALVARSSGGGIGIAPRVETPRRKVVLRCVGRLTLVGEVTDEHTGKPIQGVNVFAILGHAATDRSGKFTLAGIMRNPVYPYVWLEKEGYQPLRAELGALGELFGGFVLHRDFKMKPIPTARVEVHVTDLSLRPLAGVAVACSEDSGPPLSEVTDSHGKAVFPRVPEGDHGLTATKRRYTLVGRGLYALDRLSSQDLHLEGKRRASVDMVMAPAVTVICHVRDVRGRPLSGVEIMETFKGGEAYGETDKAGRVAAGNVLAVGSAVLAFVKKGYGTESRKIAGGEPRSLEVVLRRACSVSGIVVDESGKPVKDASCWLYHHGNGPRFDSDSTMSDGRFLIDDLRPGTWSLEVGKTGYAVVHFAPFDLRLGEDRSGLRIVLHRGVAIGLSLTTPGGSKSFGQVIAYGPLDAGGGVQPSFDHIWFVRAGSPDSELVVPGRYRVVAVPPDADRRSGAVVEELDLRCDRTVHIRFGKDPHRIRFEPALQEQGIVVELTELLSENELWPRAFGLEFGMFADADGVYRSRAVPPGTYEVLIVYTTPQEPKLPQVAVAGPFRPGPDVHEISIPPK